jgi:hypothetical protein
VRAGRRADDVEGVVDVGTQSRSASFIASFSVCERRGHRHHLGAQQLHAEHVGRLPLDIARAHEDGAGQAEARRHGGGGHAMLAGAGFRDDPRLAHALGEQDLADAVVDLVRAGVVQLVALEIDLRAAQFFRQLLGEIQRAGPADIMLQQSSNSARKAGSALAAR